MIDLTVFRNVPYFSIYYDDLADEYRKVLGGLNTIDEHHTRDNSTDKEQTKKYAKKPLT